MRILDRLVESQRRSQARGRAEIREALEGARSDVARCRDEIAQIHDLRAVADEGLVAEFERFRLFGDRIEVRPSARRKDRTLVAQTRPIAGVFARVGSENIGKEWGGFTQRDVYLTISGPGFTWSHLTDAVTSSRRGREFAALVCSAGKGAHVTAP